LELSSAYYEGALISVSTSFRDTEKQNNSDQFSKTADLIKSLNRDTFDQRIGISFGCNSSLILVIVSFETFFSFLLLLDAILCLRLGKLAQTDQAGKLKTRKPQTMSL